MFRQERNKSCAMATTRMVLHTMTNRDISERALCAISQRFPGAFSEEGGTNMGVNCPPLLALYGVKSHTVVDLSVDELARQVQRRGFRVMASIRRGSEKHAIVVDTVVGSERGQRQFAIRDPSGLRGLCSEKCLKNLLNGTAVVIDGNLAGGHCAQRERGREPQQEAALPHVQPAPRRTCVVNTTLTVNGWTIQLQPGQTLLINGATVTITD
jgi:hypothetical protein